MRYNFPKVATFGKLWHNKKWPLFLQTEATRQNKRTQYLKLLYCLFSNSRRCGSRFKLFWKLLNDAFSN